MNLSDEKYLLEICRERKNSGKHSSHIFNDIYGIEKVFREYARYSGEKTVPVVLEHALMPGLYGRDLYAKLPTMFVYSNNRQKILTRYTNKLVFSVGPTILYAKPILLEEETTLEKKRLGKNLLVFPSKTTPSIDIKYSHDTLLNTIRKLETQYDTIRICLYWKDVNLQAIRDYHALGYEVVSAGHQWEQNFFNRLRSLIEVASCTLSTYAGSPLVNSVALDTPHQVLQLQQEKYSIGEYVAWLDNIYQHNKPLNSCQTTRFFKQNFLLEHPAIMPEIFQYTKKLIGTDCYRTPQEIKALFDISNDVNAQGASYFQFNRHLAQDTLSRYNSGLKKNLLEQIAPRYRHHSCSIKRNISFIPTHLTIQEKLVIYRMARKIRKNGLYVELGSFMGASAAIVGYAAKYIQITCIDAWSPAQFKQFSSYTEPFGEKIATINENHESSTTLKDAIDKIDMLFLDKVYQDGHTFLNDLLYWYTKVKNGGYVLIHHTWWHPYIMKEIDTFFKYNVSELYSLPNLWIARIEKYSAGTFVLDDKKIKFPFAESVQCKPVIDQSFSQSVPDFVCMDPEYVKGRSQRKYLIIDSKKHKASNETC